MEAAKCVNIVLQTDVSHSFMSLTAWSICVVSWLRLNHMGLHEEIKQWFTSPHLIAPRLRSTSVLEPSDLEVFVCQKFSPNVRGVDL